jgi:hypothetical protein
MIKPKRRIREIDEIEQKKCLGRTLEAGKWSSKFLGLSDYENSTEPLLPLADHDLDTKSRRNARSS